MTLAGEFAVRADPLRVRRALRDTEAVGRCMPGVQSVSPREDGGVNVVVLAGVAVLRGRMQFRLYLEEGTHDDDLVAYRAHGTGIGSQVDVQASFRLREVNGASELAWTGEARTGGALASIGAGVLEPVTRKNIEQLIKNIQDWLEGLGA